MKKKLSAIEKLYASLWCRLGCVLDQLTEDDGHVADKIDPMRYELHDRLPDHYKSRSFQDTTPDVVVEMRRDSDRTEDRLITVLPAVSGVVEACEVLLQDGGIKRDADGYVRLPCVEVARLRRALAVYRGVV